MSAPYESHFNQFAPHIIGSNDVFTSPTGLVVPMIYADWAATGRAYDKIEDEVHGLLPYLANTHTEANFTGKRMTQEYEQARETIKDHVGANADDVLVLAGSGMTGALAHLQNVLGWRVPEHLVDQIHIKEKDRPVVFVSTAEHHSNDTSWREQNLADTVLIPHDPYDIVDLTALRGLLDAYKDRQTKVVAVTAASNVTGIRTPLHDIAEVTHEAGGRIFVDGTCAMPYDDIDMHPSDEASIDALYFSPHKFLGGQGTPGVVVFNKELYGHRQAPVRPGGGTVVWTNPWGGRRYHGFDTTSGIEAREDGGTPPFMGAIRAAKAIQLKEEMGMGNIASREAEITSQVFADLENTDGIRILGGEQHDRLPVFALVLRGLHYNAVTTLLSDRFGIQARGGCSCAGTYGHELLNIGPAQSQRITDRLDDGDMTLKPGYTRISLHPTMPSAQVGYITHALATVVVEGREWIGDYSFDSRTGEFTPRNSFIGK